VVLFRGRGGVEVLYAIAVHGCGVATPAVGTGSGTFAESLQVLIRWVVLLVRFCDTCVCPSPSDCPLRYFRGCWLTCEGEWGSRHPLAGREGRGLCCVLRETFAETASEGTQVPLTGVPRTKRVPETGRWGGWWDGVGVYPQLVWSNWHVKRGFVSRSGHVGVCVLSGSLLVVHFPLQCWAACVFWCGLTGVSASLLGLFSSLGLY
jgi:hypothetical protein